MEDSNNNTIISDEDEVTLISVARHYLQSIPLEELLVKDIKEINAELLEHCNVQINKQQCLAIVEDIQKEKNSTAPKRDILDRSAKRKTSKKRKFEIPESSGFPSTSSSESDDSGKESPSSDDEDEDEDDVEDPSEDDMDNDDSRKKRPRAMCSQSDIVELLKDYTAYTKVR